MFNTAAFLTYIFVTAITPGPNNLTSMGNASRMGLRRALPYNFGILTGFLVVAGLCTVFSSLLFSMLPRIRIAMQVIGAAYMLFLAYKTVASTPDFDTDAQGMTFLNGALFQFINPKIYIYCFTAMSSYILPHFSGVLPLAGFVMLLSFAGFASTLCWAAFGSVFRKVFARHGRVVNLLMGGLLVYCAVALFL